MREDVWAGWDWAAQDNSIGSAFHPLCHWPERLLRGSGSVYI